MSKLLWKTWASAFKRFMIYVCTDMHVDGWISDLLKRKHARYVQILGLNEYQMFIFTQQCTHVTSWMCVLLCVWEMLYHTPRWGNADPKATTEVRYHCIYLHPHKYNTYSHTVAPANKVWNGSRVWPCASGTWVLHPTQYDVMYRSTCPHMVSRVGWQSRSQEGPFPLQPFCPDWEFPWLSYQTHQGHPSPSAGEGGIRWTNIHNRFRT